VKFWKYSIMGVVAVVGICVIYIGYLYFRKSQKEDLIKRVETMGLETEILNFISRHGMEKTKPCWSYYDHYFSFNRINDLEAILIERGLKLGDKQIYFILKHYIHKEEFKTTKESIKSEPKDLDKLSGSEFEILLKRLFEKMDYSVELKARPGDQGGDLIANRGGERHLIQAKRYSGPVSNEAVQQAHLAKSFYDCTSALVVTTGEYTQGAKDAAKKAQVRLVGRKELQQMLMERLNENWR